MKKIFIVIFLTSVCILLHYCVIAQNSNKKDLSPPWYKRFVGKLDNENVIIHIQKSHKNSNIIVHTDTQEVIFNGKGIRFYHDKIEAEYNKAQENILFRAIIDGNKLIANLLVRTTNKSFSLELKEDYTDATTLKLYEYSDVEKGEFEVVFGNVNYFYYYSLCIVPEFAVEEFEKKHAQHINRYADGLKGEIEALEKEQFLSNQYYESIVYNQNNLLIIQNNHYTYEGGAHGMFGTSYTHYDLENQKDIKIDDVFVTGFEKKLAPLLSKKAQEQGIPLLYENTLIEPSTHFLLKDKEIVFLYQPYEIAPYSAGVVPISVPYAEIKHILKESSFLKRIMK